MNSYEETSKRRQSEWNDSDTVKLSPKELINEAESLKTFAFFAIAISTVATITAVVAVPVGNNIIM